MNEISIYEGIIIGGVGGAIAGIFIWCLDWARKNFQNVRDSKKIFQWLFKNTHPRISEKIQWRSTRSIASYNNLTEDRVRFLCSYSSKIVLNTSEKSKQEELWGVKEEVRVKK